MITGLYPRHHGLTVNGLGMSLSEDASTLPLALSMNGYRTHGIGKQHLQPRNAPAEQNMLESRSFWKKPESQDWNGPYYGYQTVDLLLGISHTAHLAGHYANWLNDIAPKESLKLLPEFSREPIPEDYEHIWQSAMPVELHYNTWIGDRAVAFLDEMSARDEKNSSPFYLFVSYPDPHHPFDAPSEYAIRYEPETLPKPKIAKEERQRIPPYCPDLYPWFGSYMKSFRAVDGMLEAGKLLLTEHLSESSLQKAIANTYAMIEMIDDGVGRILSTLSKHNFTENTVVFFTSDHGEYLGDHGLLHKGPASYRQVTEVSMLMKGPGITPGICVRELTGHTDIAPTILDLAGLQQAMPQGDEASLLPMLQEKSTGLREFDFGEYHPKVRKDLYNQTIRTEKWRLTCYPEHSEWGELFDLETDPGEHYNLFPSMTNSRLVQDLSVILKERFPAKP